MSKLSLAALVAIVSALSAAQASAATVRVTCEQRPDRARISVDAKNLAAGAYRTVVVSGANTAMSGLLSAVGDELQSDYDSNPADIRAGAVPIASTFIAGSVVVGKVVDANGNTVIADTVACRVRTR